MTLVFDRDAPLIIYDLTRVFGLDRLTGAAIVGNAGRESAGFTELQQLNDHNPGAGIGLFQWSGVRHEHFVTFCAQRHLDPLSIEASVEYLIFELQTAYAHCLVMTIAAHGLYAKTLAFERYYEAAGVPAINDRFKWAQEAYNLPAASRGILYTS